MSRTLIREAQIRHHGYSSLTLGTETQKYVDGANETLLWEETADFDQLIISDVICTLTALTMQTNGASGVYRVRQGGSPGVADGTQLVQLTTTNVAYVSPDSASSSSFTNPAGKQLIKLTANASSLSARARVRAFRIVFCAQ
jgi:hypothetical protein